MLYATTEYMQMLGSFSVHSDNNITLINKRLGVYS